MTMIETLRSGVNSWECDIMGHLNVRYYFARANQGMSGLLLALGLPPSALRERGLSVRARDQHVRFLRELRAGAAYSLHCGLLSASAERLEVYQELSFVHKPELAASVLSEIELVDAASGRHVPWPEALLERRGQVVAELPEGRFERGIERTPAATPPTRSEAIARGLCGGYLAPVEPEDCDVHGVMHEAAFMARISDGIGHFLKTLHLPGSPLGGAALEYRYIFHARPRLGDLVEVRSGLKSLGNKTRHLCHFVYDVETERCVASSEAVTISFDLEQRRARAISPEERAHMQPLIVPGLVI